jgi:hypothetical protein
MDIKTHLVKKVAKIPKVCTNCKKQIPPDEVYHLEEGVNQHLHSLIARKFCTECYSKLGEKKLLIGNI